MTHSVIVQMVLAVLSTFSAVAPIPKGSGGPALYFPTTVGTKLVYKSEKWGVTEIVVSEVKEKDGVAIVTCLQIGDDGMTSPWWTVSVSEKGVSCIEFDFHYDPPVKWLRLPAKVGDQWKFDSNFVVGMSNADMCGRMKVGAVEKVKTPAGEFEALRVEATGRGPGPLHEMRWFAPKVGLIKWVNNARVEFVLQSFTPGK